MYERITDENPYKVPMRIYPAIHYTMGGLWVDYNLMSTIPGLFVLGEANFSDHGANRLGASALMQGLADGYFVIPYTIGNYLASNKFEKVGTDHPAFKERRGGGAGADSGSCWASRASGRSTTSTASSARSCGNYCGMARNEQGLKTALEKIPALREEFWKNVRVLGDGEEINQSLEKAGRVADFLELGELLCLDALERRESCGGHFREEYQTEDGEALRDDEHFCHVAAWEYTGDGQPPDPPRRAADLRERPPPDPKLQVSERSVRTTRPLQQRTESHAERTIHGRNGRRTLNLTLHVWRQKNRTAAGQFVTYEARDISTDMSFLEMLDVVNERLIEKGEEPIAFDHDCREGICGQCGVVINGEAHGPRQATTTCASSTCGASRTATCSPSSPGGPTSFPVVKDLMVDRSAFDRIIAAGGFVSVRTGNAPEANDMPVPKDDADLAMDAAACIGCGACVAACPNASAMLFVAAKVGAPQRPAARPARAVPPRHLDDRPDGRRGLRELHQPRRVRGGLPEGDQPRVHRPAQPRLPQGHPLRPPPAAVRRATIQGAREGVSPALLKTWRRRRCRPRRRQPSSTDSRDALTASPDDEAGVLACSAL